MTDTALDRLDARLARIEARLDRLTAALDGPLAAFARPAAIATAVDALDDWAAERQSRGVDLDARARNALSLAESLTDEPVAAELEALIALVPKLTPLAELAATFEPTTAMVFDMFDELVRTLDARGVDVEARFHQVAGLVERLTEPEFHAHLEELLDAAPSLMAATRTGELFGRAIDEVVAAPVAPIGLLGLIRALSNPDV
ncbi:MAG: DUF1641 domain-containing protein, partial [Myxococcota bacterium]